MNVIPSEWLDINWEKNHARFYYSSYWLSPISFAATLTLISTSGWPRFSIRIFGAFGFSKEKSFINDLMLRAQSKAYYGIKNLGHFGLGLNHYTHFTSPIRRYPDLMVHRILFSILKKEKFHDKDIEEKCVHCSQREELATKAERASIKLMQVKYMSERVNEKFTGIISGINERGVFVEIISNKCEGFVRMKDIPDDYFVYDFKTNTLIGQNTKEEYCLGDKVLIRVQKTDFEKKHIAFKILSKSE